MKARAIMRRFGPSPYRRSLLAISLAFLALGCGRTSPTAPSSHSSLRWTKLSWTAFAADMIFLDSLEGWCSGLTGVIHTTDGGRTWEFQQIVTGGSYYYMSSIWFVDRQYGWVVASQGKIFHTTDGGRNWYEQTSNTDLWLNAVHFVDRQYGWAVGGDDLSGCVILHTIDGGEHWQVQQQEAWDMEYETVFFTDRNTGWVGGYELFSTRDGGQTWKQENGWQIYGINQIHVNPDGCGWIVDCNGQMMLTRDHGNTWREQKLPVGRDTIIYMISSACFLDDRTGWVSLPTYGSAHPQSEMPTCAIWSTTDGGFTWKEEFRDSTHYGRMKIQFTDRRHGWCSGMYNYLLKYNP
ncbi:MAG TPA: YCF48-related protein [Candidatus Edwardsbacteria bacterium]|nr:YCF48-related protein [Candidatus Edwardsbacteria bacterium]